MDSREKSSYLERIPSPDEIRAAIARHNREAALLKQLLRVAEKRQAFQSLEGLTCAK